MLPSIVMPIGCECRNPCNLLYYIFLHNTFIYFPIWFVRLWSQFCSYSEAISKTSLDLYTEGICSRVIISYSEVIWLFLRHIHPFNFFSVDIYFYTVETHGLSILILPKFKQILHARKTILEKKIRKFWWGWNGRKHCSA